MKNRLLVLLACLLGGLSHINAQNVFTIDEGGSTECTGQLYDTGGPDGDYGNDENHTFVICPAGGSDCIEFSFEFYSLENESSSDIITLYDGDITAEFLQPIVQFGGFAGGNGDDEGGVCFRTYATEGCISVVFESGAEGVREGFSAFWDCMPAECNAAEPIQVDTAVNAQGVAEAIRGPGTVIQNVTLNCPSGQYGVFLGEGSDLGLPTGVLLTTGSAAGAVGPNVLGNLGGSQPLPLGPGDADLEALGALLGDDSPTFDACVLELDIIVDTDELVFDYTFGSDEYPEFVDNNVNDIFAFLISGPGIEGEATLNGQRNIAVLDNGANTTVEIDSINANFNNEYYRNNQLGQSVEYDGLTSGRLGDPKTLRARADVIPCETYHLKLAIADRGDRLFDSGVFIAGLCGGLPDVDLTMTAGIDYLVEDCLTVEDSLKITFNNVKDIPQTYELQTSGTATRNQDYILPGLPTQLVFPPGRTEITIPIIVIADNEEEGEETLTFSFVTDFGCNTDVDISSVTIPLRDNIQVELESIDAESPVFFCEGETFNLSATGATNYVWSTTTGIIIATGDTTSITPAGDGTAQVVGIVGTCTDTLTFELEAVETEVAIDNPDTIRICRGDTITLTQTNNVDDQGVRWITTTGLIDPPTSPTARFVPAFSRFYVVEAGPQGDCSARDSVFVDVDIFVVPQLIEDTLICQGYPLQLVQEPVEGVGNTTYEFSPADFLDDPTDPNAIYVSDLPIDTTFTLISSVENGACTDTQTVRVDLIRSSLRLEGGDTIFRCLGDDPTLLRVTPDPFDAVENLRWFPTTAGVGEPNGNIFRVAPDQEVEYFVEATVNGCYQIDSVTVRTDSLPANTGLTLDPEKDPYCQGDTFFIRSPIYDVGDFPLITHEWQIAPGIASPQALYNAVVFAQDSALFTRVTENGACGRIDTIQVNVVKPPILIFDPDPALVCPGEPLQINVSFDPSGPTGTLEWEDPNNTLSCDDCLDPVATVDRTTVYEITVTSEGSDCTEPVEYRIETIGDVQPQLTDRTNICSGDERQIIIGGIVEDYTYRITGGGIDSDDPNVVVTPPADGTTYTVVTTTECGEFTDMVTFAFIDNYSLSINGPTTVCAGESATLTAQLSNDRAGSFVWTRPDGTTEAGLQIEISPTESATYTVTFADNFGCGTATADITVNVVGDGLEAGIVATFSNGDPLPEDGVVFSGNEITLTAVGIPDNIDVSYDWIGNLDPATASGQSIEVTVPPPGQSAPNNLFYDVVVRTVDGDCPFPASIALPIEESRFAIPELMTPNGDGTNDVFRVYFGGQITDFTLSVFNRWGQRVFSSSDVEEAWDGTKDGTPQNSDTYLYVTKFSINGTEVEEEGQFTLIR